MDTISTGMKFRILARSFQIIDRARQPCEFEGAVDYKNSSPMENAVVCLLMGIPSLLRLAKAPISLGMKKSGLYLARRLVSG